MKNLSLLVTLFLLQSFTPVLGQRQTPTPIPQKQVNTSDDVLRTTANLVQLDVVVTDKEGKQIPELQPEDFEIIEDKDKQRITNFSYVTLGPPVSVSQPAAPTNGGKPGTAPIVAAPLRPEHVHRTIALVVDDLGLSFESIISVKQALKRFVNEQMQPNDLVAVLRTSRGVGSLQQFTEDKRQLLAAIDNISWYPSGRGGLSPNPQIDTQIGQDSTQGAQLINEMEETRAATYSVGTIQTLSRILQALKDLPGRKVLTLYSESFMLFTSQGRNVQLLDALQKLADRANQSSAVIYTIDASGLNPLDLTASDRVGGLSYTFNPETFGSVLQPRNRVATRRVDAPQSAAAQAEADSASAFRRLEGLVQQKENSQYQSQTVLSFLAEETGGTFTKNSNDLSVGTQRMLENESGYYLIGYRPKDVTIDPATGRRRAHDIGIKLKRPGLRLRSRGHYYGLNPEAVTTSNRRGRDQQLSAALTSPFAASGIGLRITPIFGNDPTEGSYLRVLIHVDANALTFSAQPGGSRRTLMDVVAVNFGSEGRVLDQFSDTQTIDVADNAYQQILKDGLVFILNVPTKKPGPIQLRVAVRDVASERVGAASQFVQVPDLSANRLALSGIYVGGSKQPLASGASPNEEKKAVEPESMAGPAVRRLRQGLVLSYSYIIYNAQLDSAGRPQLQTQMRLFRDGKESFTGKPLSPNLEQQADMKRLRAGGRLLVGSNLVPGEYVLQVTVTDTLAKNRRSSTATQWIDFEIVN